MMFSQWRYFLSDYKRATGKYWFRALYLWMSWGVIGIFFYRLERSLYLLMGGGMYALLRALLSPLLYLVQALSHININYKANIGPGLMILHHSMGVVINGSTVIGKNLTLVGGNIIGVSNSELRKKFIIGANVSLGANAVIIGPVEIGDNVKIGAMACVLKDAPSDCTLVGVPAKLINPM